MTYYLKIFMFLNHCKFTTEYRICNHLKLKGIKILLIIPTCFLLINLVQISKAIAVRNAYNKQSFAEVITHKEIY